MVWQSHQNSQRDHVYVSLDSLRHPRRLRFIARKHATRPVDGTKPSTPFKIRLAAQHVPHTPTRTATTTPTIPNNRRLPRTARHSILRLLRRVSKGAVIRDSNTTMTNLHPYLNFDGTTEAAMKLYADVFHGSLEIHRFGDAPMACAPEAKHRVMHATLKSGNLVLMAADSHAGQPVTPGGNVHISLNFADTTEQQRVWDRLVDGATVTMPLGDQFFGRFGMLTDKFGVQWMFHFAAAPSA